MQLYLCFFKYDSVCMSACRVHSSILNLAYVILKYEELNATMLNFKLYVNRL